MKGILPLLFATATLATTAHAQNATTTPVGAMTFSFPATTQATPAYISIPLTSSPVYSGVVETLGTNTLSFTTNPFTSGSFAQNGAPFFLRFQSGAQAGRTILITANSANSLTLDVTDNSSQTTNLNASGFTVAAGDSFQIFPGDTLASFFGDNSPQNPLMLVGSSIYVTADNVAIYNKATSKFDAFYFNTTTQNWRPNTIVTNVNNKVLYPESTILVTRRANRPAVSFTVVGDVPSVPPLTKTIGSAAYVYASTRYPVDMSLSQISIPNWTKNNVYVLADTLAIYNPALSKMEAFYQRADNTWRKVGDTNTDRSGLIVPAGQSLLITKRGTVSGASSFLKTPLPYSL